MRQGSLSHSLFLRKSLEIGLIGPIGAIGSIGPIGLICHIHVTRWGISEEIIALFGEDHPALQVVAVARQAALFFRRGAAQLFHQVFEKFILGFAQRNDAAGLGV